MTSKIMTFQTGFADLLAISHHDALEYCFGKVNANFHLNLFTFHGANVVREQERINLVFADT